MIEHCIVLWQVLDVSVYKEESVVTMNTELIQDVVQVTSEGK
jgi:hypothetical protein